jgi:hypothetical protein
MFQRHHGVARPAENMLVIIKAEKREPELTTAPRDFLFFISFASCSAASLTPSSRYALSNVEQVSGGF